jgi:hypothetical protein
MGGLAEQRTDFRFSFPTAWVGRTQIAGFLPELKGPSRLGCKQLVEAKLPVGSIAAGGANKGTDVVWSNQSCLRAPPTLSSPKEGRGIMTTVVSNYLVLEGSWVLIICEHCLWPKWAAERIITPGETGLSLI